MESFLNKVAGISTGPATILFLIKLQTVLQGRNFVGFSQSILFKTGFRSVRQKESVVKSPYSSVVVCTLWVCNFTKMNSIIDIFLRTFWELLQSIIFVTFDLCWRVKLHERLHKVGCEAKGKRATRPIFLLSASYYKTSAK